MWVTCRYGSSSKKIWGEKDQKKNGGIENRGARGQSKRLFPNPGAQNVFLTRLQSKMEG